MSIQEKEWETTVDIRKIKNFMSMEKVNTNYFDKQTSIIMIMYTIHLFTGFLCKCQPLSQSGELVSYLSLLLTNCYNYISM